MKKRLLSWLLILALCLSLLPAAALAEDAPEQTEAPVVREQTEALPVQERAESVRAVNETAVQAAHTNHPICGAAHTNIGDHTADKCANVTWTAWNGVDAIPYDSATKTAYVYLSSNAEREETLAIADGYTLYLCLNGHSLTKTTEDSNPSFEGIITIYKGAQFTLCDCRGGGKITHEEGVLGRGVRCGDSSGSATFAMFGGEISGNRVGSTSGAGQDGAGVEVHNAIFNMYGGRIADNHVEKTSNDGGGGVYAHGIGGGFTMYGGEISDNTSAGDGGGVSAVGASFTMKGGSITNNTASAGDGGGAALYNGTFELSGGTITNNSATRNGGGVYTNENLYTGRTASGSVNITGNKNAAGADNNVYLSSGNFFVIGAGGLGENAKIGVTYADPIAAGKYVTVAYGANSGYTENAIFSDKAEPYATRQEGSEVRLYNGLPHEHPICGDKKCSEGHDKVTYQPLTKSQLTQAGKDSSITSINSYYDLPAGNWYLKDDLTLNDGVLRIQGEVKLCLNGHTIQNSISGHAIFINGENASLTLCDCSTAQSGTITTNCKGRGVTIWNGSFTMYGGSIAGNGAADSSRDGYGGAGVYVGSMTFTMYGGTITGNQSNTSRGGGVYVYGGTFNMYGGSITGNSAKSNNGGGVYMYNSTVNMYGGSITGNSAKLGGGVYVDSAGKLTLQGAPSITGNTDSAASNVYLKNGRTITLKSALTAGAAIGVTTEKSITDGSYAVVAAGDTVTLSDTDLSAFTSDDGYDKRLNGNKIFFTKGDLHEHAICGATCSHETEHGNELWQPLTYDAATMTLYCGGEAVKSYDYRILAGVDDTYIYYKEYQLPAGNYYLAENIALNGGTANEKTYVGGLIRTKGYDLNVNLCLNGFTLSATNPNTPLLSVPGTQTLTLSDCQGGGKIQTDAGGYNVLQVFGDEGKGGTFTMYGGTLSGARTGVYTYNYGVVNLFGGTITGNECGVEIGGNGSVTVGGTVNITGNTKQNLNLYTGGTTTAIISIDPTLTQASHIGVSSSLTAGGTSPIQVATGAENDALKYTDIFTADAKSDGYVVIKDGTELQLKKHTHNWSTTLSKDKATITLTCSNDDGNCPLGGDGGSVTLKAPAHTVYGDGEAANVTFEETDWAVVPNDSRDVRYWKGTISDETYLGIGDESAPTGAGTYIAKYAFSGVEAQITYTIAKAPLTIKANDATTVYGEAAVTNGVTCTGFVNSEDENAFLASLTYSFSYTLGSDTGLYIIMPAGQISDNYNVTVTPGTLTVEPREVTLTWHNYENRTYGDGKYVYATAGNLLEADVGKVQVMVMGNGANAAGTFTATAFALSGYRADNYKLPTTGLTQEYTIGLAEQTLTFASSGDQSVTYGDTFDNPATNDCTDGGKVTYTSSNETVATVDENGVVTAKSVGTTIITATAAAVDGKYGEAKEGYTLAVTQRNVTLTVNAASRTYGDANPDFTAELTGGTYAPGDNFQSLGLTLSTTADQTTGVGEYDVTGTASNTNYNVTVLGEKKLTITQRPITVEVDAVSRTYGERNPNFTANTVKSGSLVKGDMLVLTLTTTADRTSPVGKYDVTLASSDSPNYAVTVEGKDKLTVTVKPITVTVDPATRAYGEANPAFTATVPSGALVGDDTVASLNLTLSSDATATSDVRSYDVTGSANNRNYEVTIDGTGKLTVTKKELTENDLEFAGTPITKVYDGKTDATVTVQINDSAKVKAEDVLPDVTGIGTYNSKDVKDASMVTFVTAETESRNYILPANLTREHEASITKRVISIKSVTTAPKQYDRDTNAWSCITDVSFDNLVSGETLTKSKDYGITEATFNSADVELANTITGVVGITNPNLNYTFVDETGSETSRASFTTSGKISKANGGTLDPVELTIRCTNRDEQIYTIDQSKLPGGQIWTFSTSAAMTGKAALSTNTIGANTGVLTYQLSDGAAGDTVTWTVTITCGNYEDYTLTITLKLIALDEQENFKFADSTITKTYGDADFTVAATGAETGSNVTYALDPSSDSSIAEVAADGTVTIKKTGTVIITATAAATRDYAEATARCTLTIERAKLTVTALDRKITVHQSAPDLSHPVEGEDYTVTGTLFGADALTAVTLTYSETPDTSKPGEYTINVTATLANYDITVVPGKLTIEQSKNSQRLGILDGAQTTPGGTVETSPKNALPGQTVTITVTPKKGYELGDLIVRDIHGDKIDLVRVSDSEYTFVMPESSVSIDARFLGAGETGESLFRDVPASAYYYDAVQWAAENDITGGVGNGLFAPDGDCTRAQIVTFLWRAAGSPEPQSKADFTDVPANAYYAKAVAWALENGITKGTSATTFSPDDPCTRAQAVTFLARALSAKAEGTADFLDVAESAYYCGAVAWAAENDVTSGVGGKRFAPDQTCTRAQIVTFLYRAYNK